MLLRSKLIGKAGLIALLAGASSLGATATAAIANEVSSVSINLTEAPAMLAQANGTIVDVAAANDNFDTLVQAVQTAGLVDTLSGDGPFTVFAPTDDAFAELPDGALDALLQPENRDLLTEILTYHVVPDEVTSDELETGVVDTLNGGVAVRVDPDRVVVNDGSVIIPDVPASNGVIHAINRVLIPPSTGAELARRLSAPRALW
ncbi:MAG: fasciclin domain-containing protein [Cyanobacteria bacterium P01_H01_bin.119]